VAGQKRDRAVAAAAAARTWTPSARHSPAVFATRRRGARSPGSGFRQRTPELTRVRARGLRPRPRGLGRRLLREQALVGATDLARCAPAARRRAAFGRADAVILYFPRPHPPPTRPRKATSGRARRDFPRGRSGKWHSRLIVGRRRCWRHFAWRGQPGPPYLRLLVAPATRASATAPRRPGLPGGG